MQQTVIDGTSMWSLWKPERGLHFNSYFIEHPDGNLAVDPLPLEDADAAEIEAAGGIAWIVITNRDHERGAAAVAKRFNAKIAAGEAEAPSLTVAADRTLRSGDSIGGAIVFELHGLKTAGEIALYFPQSETVAVGDALWGQPAGALRMMPDEMLGDPTGAARSLRVLRSVRPRHILVGDGAPIFWHAWEALNDFFQRRSDAHPNRANIDELHFRRRDLPARFTRESAEIGFLLGAEKLGYAATRLAPGATHCPMHWHTSEEELFIVWDGTPTIEYPGGSDLLRRGDFVCFPANSTGAHRLVNHSDRDATLILIANSDSRDVCFYPDSKKLLVEATDTLVRSEPQLDYFDGEA